MVARSVSRRPGFERARAALAERRIPVVVRSTGGGVVPQGPGIVNLSATVPLSAARGATGADFARLCAPLQDWLGARGLASQLGHVPGSFCDGAHNVMVHGRKLAGAAQRRGRTHALLHMVVLVDTDLPSAVGAVRLLREHLGDAPPRVDAHTTLAGLGMRPADLLTFAAELQRRFLGSAALRAPHRGDDDGQRDDSHPPRSDRTHRQRRCL
ncbi:MAG: hypothetical protein AAGH15_14880 [Myxococcota bacterium]